MILLASEPTTPVPVEQEPRHHVRFSNDLVEVIQVVLPPGASTAFHTHSHDRVAVDLTAATLVVQVLGQAEQAPEPTVPGALSSRANASAPLTHRVQNVGTTPYEVVDVEFLRRPTAGVQSPAQGRDGGIDNPSAAIQIWRLSPGETAPLHVHRKGLLMLSVTRCRLTIVDPVGHAEELALERGAFRWSDTPLSHSLRNTTTAPLQIVELELR